MAINNRECHLKVMFKSCPAMEKKKAQRGESKALSNGLRLRQNLTSYGRTAAERAALCQGELDQQTGLWIVSALGQAWCTNDTMSTHKAWFIKESEASLSPLLPPGIQGGQRGCREAQSQSHCGIDAPSHGTVSLQALQHCNKPLNLKLHVGAYRGRGVFSI